MAIDPLAEDLVPLSKIANSLPKRPSPASLWRWHRKGINGVRLETVLVGGRRYTTHSAWATFIRARTLQVDGTSQGKAIDEPKIRSQPVERRLKKMKLIDSSDNS